MPETGGAFPGVGCTSDTSKGFCGVTETCSGVDCTSDTSRGSRGVAVVAEFWVSIGVNEGAKDSKEAEAGADEDGSGMSDAWDAPST